MSWRRWFLTIGSKLASVVVNRALDNTGNRSQVCKSSLSHLFDLPYTLNEAIIYIGLHINPLTMCPSDSTCCEMQPANLCRRGCSRACLRRGGLCRMTSQCRCHYTYLNSNMAGIIKPPWVWACTCFLRQNIAWLRE